MDYSEAIKNSRCFGVAFDDTVKECKVCEVGRLCRQKTLGVNVSDNPAPKPAESAKDANVSPATPRPQPKDTPQPKEKAAKKAPKAASKEYDESMPNFSDIKEMDDLLKLAKERGLNIRDFDRFDKVNIKRMRVIMALKTTYEK